MARVFRTSRTSHPAFGDGRDELAATEFIAWFDFQVVQVRAFIKYV
jgi:hypothetical protein